MRHKSMTREVSVKMAEEIIAYRCHDWSDIEWDMIEKLIA